MYICFAMKPHKILIAATAIASATFLGYHSCLSVVDYILSPGLESKTEYTLVPKSDSLEARTKEYQSSTLPAQKQASIEPIEEMATSKEATKSEIVPILTGSFEDYINMSDEQFLALPVREANDYTRSFIHGTNCRLSEEKILSEEGDDRIFFSPNSLVKKGYCNMYKISDKDSRLPILYLNKKLSYIKDNFGTFVDKQHNNNSRLNYEWLEFSWFSEDLRDAGQKEAAHNFCINVIEICAEYALNDPNFLDNVNNYYDILRYFENSFDRRLHIWGKENSKSYNAIRKLGEIFCSHATDNENVDIINGSLRDFLNVEGMKECNHFQ